LAGGGGLERFGGPALQTDSFRFLLFLLLLLVGIIATFHGVNAPVFLIEITKHAAHAFLTRAANRGHVARLDEFGGPFFDCGIFLRCALGEFAIKKLVHDVPLATASFHTGRGHFADSVIFRTTGVETFSGFRFLPFFHFLKTGHFFFADGV